MGYFGNVYDWLTDAAHWNGAEGVPIASSSTSRSVRSHCWCARHRGADRCRSRTLPARWLPGGQRLEHRAGGAAIAILLIAVLALGIADPPEYLTRIGVVSIPAFLALVLLASRPCSRFYVGVSEVDADIRDGAAWG
jgi:hypothetical protein